MTGKLFRLYLRRYEWVVVLLGALLASGSFLAKENWVEEAKEHVAALRESKASYDSKIGATGQDAVTLAIFQLLSLHNIRVEGLLLEPAHGMKPDAQAAYTRYYSDYYSGTGPETASRLDRIKRLASSLPEVSPAVKRLTSAVDAFNAKLSDEYDGFFSQMNRSRGTNMYPLMNPSRLASLPVGAGERLVEAQREASDAIPHLENELGEEYERQLLKTEAKASRAHLVINVLFYVGLLLTAIGKVTRSYKLETPS